MEKIQATYTLKEDTKFGAAIVEASPEDLKAAGFELGDSIDLEFSNGKKYYDGNRSLSRAANSIHYQE